jgi:predicted amidohydrolase YtcJ
MKFFADGGMNCRIDLHVQGQRATQGYLFPNLSKGIARAVEHGFQVAVHAMGNVGVESTLEAFENVARRAKGQTQRFRLEHCTLATPGQIRRLGSLGAVGVIQPGFLELFLHARDLGFLIEFDEAEWAPFRTLLDAGVTLAASSDDPCGPLAPLSTSCYGTTRRSHAGVPLGPKQGIPYEEWLRAYTIGSACAGGQENERGSLSAGKRADLVIVEGKLDAQGEAVVVETWVGGEQVYRRDAAQSDVALGQ